MPRNSVEVSVPGSTLKTSRVSYASPGAEPAAILTNAIQRDHQDEQHRDALDDEQRGGRAARGHDGEPEHEEQRQAADHEPGPARLVGPDAGVVEELRAEDAGRAGGDQAVEGVRAEQAQAGGRARLRSERRAGEDVDRAGVLVVLAEPDEHVGDQQHRHRGEEERQRRGSADQTGRALRVDVRGHARRHQRDRDADGLPEGEASTEPGAGVFVGRACESAITMRVWSTSPTWTRPNAMLVRPPPRP